MVSLYRDPNGERIFSGNANAMEVSRSKALPTRRNTDRESELEARILELEALLRESRVR